MAKQLEDYMQWPEIEALMYAECGRPETVLTEAGGQKPCAYHGI